MPRKTSKSEGSQPPAAAVIPAAPPEVKGVSTAHSHALLPHFHGLLQKIKQRNVGRVAILYIVVCYVILEPFEMFFHLLDLPVWTGRTAVALMVLGFPVALLLAWVYEITPTGIKPSTDVDPQQSIARQTGRKLDYAIIAVLAVALTYFVVDKFWISKRVAVVAPAATAAPATVSAPASPVIPEKSVAVLPFVDMSEKKDQEYFSDGLSEELIDMLGKVPDLRVPARTSSFYFKGKQTTIADIAKMLSVAHVLEGSVRKSGNKLRVTAQLIRVDTGYHLWSETYDREFDDIFKIQDEIAASVVQALKVSLSGHSLPQATGTRSTEAYNFYLQARSIWLNTYSKAEFETCIDYLRKALKADPSYAAAWAQLSAALSEGARAGYLAPKSSIMADSVEAVRRALELDPRLPEAHAWLANTLIKDNFDLAGGEEQIRLALAIDANHSLALLLAGQVAIAKGRLDEAIAFLQRSIENDPVNPTRYWNLVPALTLTGRYADALSATKESINLGGRNGIHNTAGEIMLLQGEALNALAEMDLESDEDTRLGCTCRVNAYDALDRKADADAALAYIEKKYESGNSFRIASVYAKRGEFDKAFNWLDRAYRERDSEELLYIKVDPDLRNLHADPRYHALLAKLKLVD